MAQHSDWGDYHSANHRTSRLAALTTRPAFHHLMHHAGLTADSAVLDFGCGYFDLGVALAPQVARMDGLEIDEASLRLARSRIAKLPNAAIHSRSEDVPAAAYDLITANSVFQYLADDAEVLRTLEQFRGWLKPSGLGEVLLIDLIPAHYSPHRDGLRSMWVATMNGLPFSMARFLWKAMRSPHRRQWWVVDPERMNAIARESGFDCERLPKNLAPSLQRFTCRLRAK
jgi:SAM-dependent methyltransferase